jgi:hypothetical protein
MIPDKPLDLDLPAIKNLELDDFELLFEKGGFSVRGFKAFMGKHSNWSQTDIGRLTVEEMNDVRAQIMAKLNENAAPKASGADS